MPLDGLNATFVTLLKEDPENPSFTATESQDGKHVVIKTPSKNAERLLASLKDIFKSHSNTAAHVPFKVNILSTASTTQQATIAFSTINYNLFNISEIEKLNANQILEKFFGITKLQDIGQPEWKTNHTQNGQIIYSHQCTSKRDVSLRKNQIDSYKSILSHATWNDLYSALAVNNSHCIPDNAANDSEEMGNGPLSSHLEQLFCIREEDGKFIIYFDCRGLIKCILAPQLELQTQQHNSSYSQIFIDKLHFMKYMSIVLSQDVLLHKHQEGKLLPITIGCNNALQSNTLIDFAVDCSGSMESVFPELKKLLKVLIQRLHDHKSLDNHATTIKLSRFGSRNSTFPSIVLPLTQLQILFDTIDGFAKPDQQTAIYQFLHQQHTYYKSLDNYNIVSILVSDGQDNDSESIYKLNATKDDVLSKTLSSLAKAISPPQFFSIEIGDRIDELVLDIIKQATNGTRIKAGNDLHDFKLIFDHIGQLSLYRSFIHFAQETRQFKLPAIEGKITIADPVHYLEPDRLFTINGTDCVATSSTQELKPQQSSISSVETQTEIVTEALVTAPVVTFTTANTNDQTTPQTFAGLKRGFLLSTQQQVQPSSKPRPRP